METVEDKAEYFAVIDPQGILVHTTISLSPQTAIDEWLQTEGSINGLANLVCKIKGQPEKCLPSWEGFEAEGYSVIPVTITFKQSYAIAP